jgi:hypothetical protein
VANAKKAKAKKADTDAKHKQGGGGGKGGDGRRYPDLPHQQELKGLTPQFTDAEGREYFLYNEKRFPKHYQSHTATGGIVLVVNLPLALNRAQGAQMAFPAVDLGGTLTLVAAEKQVFQVTVEKTMFPAAGYATGFVWVAGFTQA